MTGTSSATPPAATLLQLMTGCWVTQAIYIAAKLGIADLLQDEPKAPAELAEATRTDAGALYRVLRALASVGIFAEDGDGRFHLTPMAERLQSDAPRSLRSYAVMLVSRSTGERGAMRSTASRPDGLHSSTSSACPCSNIGNSTPTPRAFSMRP